MPAPEAPTGLVPLTEDQPADEQSMDFQKVKDDVGATLERAKESTAETRDTIVSQLRSQMDKLDAKIDEWKQKGGDLSGDAKERWEERRQELDKQRQAFRDKLNELGDESGSAWEEMKSGLSNAWDELRKAADDAAEEFK